MDEHRAEIRRLAIVINRMDGLYYQIAKMLGVKYNALYTLYALDDGEPHSQKQISDEWLIPRTTINTIVREYVDKGYITLVHTEHSKEKNILLTESGKAYARQLLQRIYTAEELAMSEALKNFDSNFITALECFTDHLQRSLPPAPEKKESN